MAEKVNPDVMQEVLPLRLEVEICLRATAEGYELTVQPICSSTQKHSATNWTMTFRAESFADAAMRVKWFAHFHDAIARELPEALTDMVASFALCEALPRASEQTFDDAKNAWKITRDNILKDAKRSFNRRRKMPKGSQPELTKEEIEAQVIKGWDILERRTSRVIHSPRQEELAAAIGVSETTLKKMVQKYRAILIEDMELAGAKPVIKDRVKIFPINGDEELKPTYKTFLNAIRFARTLRGNQVGKT